MLLILLITMHRHTADSVIRFFIIVTSTRILIYLAYKQENIKMNSIAGCRHSHQVIFITLCFSEVSQ